MQDRAYPKKLASHGFMTRFTRGEKVPTLKLAVVQYAVLGVMLALAAGLWRLQILGAQNFKMLAEQNRHPGRCRELGLAPRGKLFDRENFSARRRQLSVGFALPGARARTATWMRTCR